MLKDPWLKTLIVLLVIIAASYLGGVVWALAVRFADILLLLVLAWVVAFALEPVTYLLQARSHLNRGVAVALVYLGLLVILSLSTLLLIPIIALQVSQLGVNLPDYVANVDTWLQGSQTWLAGRGVIVDISTLLDYQMMAPRIEALGPTIVNNALGLATGVASVLFSLVLVMMFSFYMALDRDRLTGALLQALPQDRRDEASYFIYSANRTFGGFIRGQLIQATVYALGTAAIMGAADLSYIAVVSIFSFIIMMVPFIGPILAIILPVTIAVFVHPDQAWWVFVPLLLLQQVVLNVLSPKVLSTSVGMHPLLVLLALLVGSKLAGGWGAIFAVPVAGTMVAMITFYRMTIEERKRHTDDLAQAANGFPVSGNGPTEQLG